MRCPRLPTLINWARSGTLVIVFAVLNNCAHVLTARGVQRGIARIVDWPCKVRSGVKHCGLPRDRFRRLRNMGLIVGTLNSIFGPYYYVVSFTSLGFMWYNF